MFRKSLNIKYNQKLKTVGLALFLIFIIIFIFSAVYFDKKISPFMNQYTVMKGQQMMTDLFGKTVNQKMDEMNLTYDKLIDISYSKAGEIQSMNTDVVTINRLKNEVTVQLSEIFPDRVPVMITRNGIVGDKRYVAAAVKSAENDAGPGQLHFVSVGNVPVFTRV